MIYGFMWGEETFLKESVLPPTTLFHLKLYSNYVVRTELY